MIGSTVDSFFHVHSIKQPRKIKGFVLFLGMYLLFFTA